MGTRMWRGRAVWRWLTSAAVIAAAAALTVCQAASPAFARWMTGGISWYYTGLVNGYLLCLVTDRLLRKRRKADDDVR
jgi:hypothetical protein